MPNENFENQSKESPPSADNASQRMLEDTRSPASAAAGSNTENSNKDPNKGENAEHANNNLPKLELSDSKGHYENPELAEKYDKLPRMSAQEMADNLNEERYLRAGGRARHQLNKMHSEDPEKAAKFAEEVNKRLQQHGWKYQFEHTSSGYQLRPTPPRK